MKSPDEIKLPHPMKRPGVARFSSLPPDIIRSFRRAAASAATLLLLSAPFTRVFSAEEERSISVKVLPESAYPTMVYTLRLDAKGLESGKRYWSWSATAGEILSDGEREVFWKAPAKPGKVRITVAELGTSGTSTDLRWQVEVEVEAPSTEGMVYIPPGVFNMGDTWTDTKDPVFVPTFQNLADKPPHRVYLDGYWIDRHKVSNRKYAEFLNDAYRQGLVRVTADMAVGRHEGAEIPFYKFRVEKPGRRGQDALLVGALSWDGSRFQVKGGMEDHPVVDVTWAGARAYALFHGKRLPTEAEWEKAGRGTDRRRFPWGDELPTKYHANVGNYYGYHVPVGHFSPTGDSPYRVADVLGGFEWVEDWYDSHYYWDNYSAVPFENPRGPAWGFDRVVRGIGIDVGFYENQSFTGPLSFRYQWDFESRQAHLFAHFNTGFRTALPGRRGQGVKGPRGQGEK